MDEHSDEMAMQAAGLEAFSKQFDVTQILRENPDVLNVLANFPFLFNNFNGLEKMTAEETGERSAKSSPDINFSSCHETQSDEWFVCFKGPSVLATALAASLNVISRGINEDGYEYYDCLNRLRFKCSYRVRMRRYGESFVCEEFGVHRHKADTQVPLSSTGLPRSMREIVDESFRCNWSYVERQKRLGEEAKRLGLEMGQKMNRQIDNRLSYLRRTRNIRQMQQLEDKLNVSKGSSCSNLNLSATDNQENVISDVTDKGDGEDDVTDKSATKLDENSMEE